MKSKFLFSTLVMAAAFSACTQEDIAVDNENASMEEIVGAKLLGNGFTVNPNNGFGSRVALDDNGNAQWTEGDKAGVAWTVKSAGKVADDQSRVTLNSVANTIYANHMLVYGKEEGFTSRSNVYEGWHFSYAPYKRMSKPEELVMTVNPVLTKENLKIDRYDNMPQISNAAFVTDDDVDADGKVSVKFPLQWVANSIQPNLNVSSVFTEDDTLSTIKITGITLNAGNGNNLFTNTFKVVPSKLGETNIGKDGKDSTVVDETYYSRAFVCDAKDSTVTTVIDNAEIYNLGKSLNKVRMFLAPTQSAASVDTTDLSFRIDVEGGYFTVAYEGNESVNDTAIITMLDLLKDGLDVNGDTIMLTKTAQKIKNIPMELSAENFTADYTIDSYAKWEAAVKIANALGEEKPTFVIKAGEEILFPAGKVLVPAKGVNVVSSNGSVSAWLAFANTTEWNDNMGTIGGGAGVKVKNGGVLTVNKTVAATNFVVEVGGTINAGANSYLTTHTAANGVKNDGRIVVEYGAKVNPAGTSTGVIAYVATKKDETNPVRISNLISADNDKGEAHVNTIIVGDSISLDLTKPINGSNSTTESDPYNDIVTPGQGGSNFDYGDLTNIAFEINGGTVTSTNEKSVKDIIMNGGSVENINVSGKLTLVSGTNTIENSSIASLEIKNGINNTIDTETIGSVVAIENGTTNTIKNAAITGNVEVKAGTTTFADASINGTLTNKATVNVNGEDDVTIKGIVNEGVMNVNTTVYVETIDLKKSTSTTIADGDYIWYTEDYEQGGTTKGLILNPTEKLAKDIAKANSAGTASVVTLEADTKLTEALTVTGIVTIDLNGKTIEADENYTSTSKGLIRVDNENAVLVIGNGTVDASGYNGNISAICVNKGNVVIEEGYYRVGDDGTERNDCVIANNGAQITINGGIFEYTGTIAEGHKFLINCVDNSNSKITVNGGEFKNYVPSYEDIQPAGTTDKEVVLGTDKKVYKGTTEVMVAHSGTEDIWYTVK